MIRLETTPSREPQAHLSWAFPNTHRNDQWRAESAQNWRPDCKRVYKSTVCPIWRKTPLEWSADAQNHSLTHYLWGRVKRRKYWLENTSKKVFSPCVLPELDWGKYSHHGRRRKQTQWCTIAAQSLDCQAVQTRETLKTGSAEATPHRLPVSKI